MQQTLEKLAAAGIEAAPLPGIERYALCARGEYGALVSISAAGFGRVGSSGLLTDQGLAMLVWRGDAAMFISKGREQAAGPGQVEALRAFMSDLEAALAAA